MGRFQTTLVSDGHTDAPTHERKSKSCKTCKTNLKTNKTNNKTNMQSKANKKTNIQTDKQKE